MSPEILLVEDDPSDEKLALRAFARCEPAHRVAVARDGAEALNYFFGANDGSERRELPLPRLVLLDLKLPRVSGLDVLRELKADGRTRLVPVVVLSASREEADLVGSLSLGANAYVRKPLDFSEFVSTARTLLGFWLGVNEPVLSSGRAP